MTTMLVILMEDRVTIYFNSTFYIEKYGKSKGNSGHTVCVLKLWVNKS